MKIYPNTGQLSQQLTAETFNSLNILAKTMPQNKKGMQTINDIVLFWHECVTRHNTINVEA